MNTDPPAPQGHEATILQAGAPRQPNQPSLLPPPFRPLWLLRTVGWSLLLGLGLAWLISQSLAAGRVSSDFCQDFIAARWVLQGQSPYAPLRAWPAFSTCTVPLNYNSHPPFSVLLVLPFGLLSRGVALEVWAVVSLAAYLLSGLLLLRIVGWGSLRGVTLFVCLSLFWNPFGVATGAQNFAQLLTLLLVLAWYLERQGKQGWAGGVLGVVSLLKIWPLALFLTVLVQRRWRGVLTGGITILVGTLITLPILGFSAYTTYLGPVRLEETPAVPHEVNISLVGALARLWTGYSDPSVVAFPPLLSGLNLTDAVLLGEGVAALMMLGTFALVVWGLRRVQGAVGAALCQGLLVSVLLLGFPITWNWGLITFLFPLATTVLALRSLRRPPRWWFWLLGVGLLVLWDPLWLPLTLVRWWPQWGGLLFGLPTLGLLLFALAQALLLYWAVMRPAAPAGTEAALAFRQTSQKHPQHSWGGVDEHQFQTEE